MSEGSIKKFAENKFFAIFFIFIINISYVFANSITAAAVFDVKNYPPKIESINVNGNLIKIEASDLNGYSDIKNARVYNNYFDANASFESGEGIKAIYTVKIKDLSKIKRPFDIYVDLSDNDNKASSNEQITGLAVNNKGFGTSIIDFFKRMLGFL